MHMPVLTKFDWSFLVIHNFKLHFNLDSLRFRWLRMWEESSLITMATFTWNSPKSPPGIVTSSTSLFSLRTIGKQKGIAWVSDIGHLKDACDHHNEVQPIPSLKKFKLGLRFTNSNKWHMVGPPIEPRKKPSYQYFPLYWLVDRDPYNGLL